MRILALRSSTYGRPDVTFRFDTAEEIQFAWKHIVENNWLDSFSYRPGAEGIDANRAFVEDYLAKQRATKEYAPIGAELIERLLGKFWGADLNRRIVDVVKPA